MTYNDTFIRACKAGYGARSRMVHAAGRPL